MERSSKTCRNPANMYLQVFLPRQALVVGYEEKINSLPIIVVRSLTVFPWLLLILSMCYLQSALISSLMFLKIESANSSFCTHSVLSYFYTQTLQHLVAFLSWLTMMGDCFEVRITEEGGRIEV